MKHGMLVIDHIFHQRTRSSDFFFDILRLDFDIDVRYIDPEGTVSMDIFKGEHEYCLIWQLDFVAVDFILENKKVIVVPMYDGSGSLPSAHWTLLKQASFINFSLDLHLRAVANGCRSLLVKYFPDPSHFHACGDFQQKRLFFWERLPQSAVNAGFVAKVLGEQLDFAHIHSPTDHFDQAANVIAEPSFACNVKRSEWFENRDDYDAAVDGCNIYFAPRPAEGIGLAMLEAMARGMLIIAYDLPTHNEYICNWQNGILVNHSITRVPLDEFPVFASRIGACARETVIKGHAAWRKSQQNIIDFIRETKSSKIPEFDFLSAFAKNAKTEYQKGVYEYTKFLENNPLALNVIARWGEKDKAEEINISPRLGTDNIVLFFGKPDYRIRHSSGWSDFEGTHIWAVERVSEVKIKVSDLVTGRVTVYFEVRALNDRRLDISVNEKYTASFQISSTFQYICFDTALEDDTTRFRFTVDTLETSSPDPRTLAFAVRVLRIVPIL